MSALVALYAPGAPSQKGTPSPRPLTGGRTGGVAAPAGPWPSADCCRQEGEEGTFLYRCREKVESSQFWSQAWVRICLHPARGVTLGKFSNLPPLGFLFCAPLSSLGGWGMKIGVPFSQTLSPLSSHPLSAPLPPTRAI